MDYTHVHLVGCEGVGMSALAHVLLKNGVTVTGSDLKPGSYSQQLEREGASIQTGHNAVNLQANTDLVVISAAIPEKNPEVQEARARNIPVVKYAEMLGRLSKNKCTTAIAGTHGKSTTSGMMAYLLYEAGLDPSFIIGAKVRQLCGNARVGSSEHFVVEACEYDRSFLNLHPQFAIITNIEPDHLDYYKDIAEIGQAFDQFAQKVPSQGLIVIEQSARHRLTEKVQANIQTYSIHEPAEWNVCNVVKHEESTSFEVLHHGQKFGEFEVTLPGIHNVSNALAVIALGNYLGIPQAAMRDAIKHYAGVGRRFEILSTSPITIIDDYAHHPTKIKAVLSAVEDRCHYNKLWCVFQPHQASRTYHLFEDFAKAFAVADEVIVTDIFFARDSQEYKQKVNSNQLVQEMIRQGKSAWYIPTFPEVQKFLQENWQPGDLVITIGAGSITQLAQQLVDLVRIEENKVLQVANC